MMLKSLLVSLAAVSSLALTAKAETQSVEQNQTNMIEELDPFAPNISETLEQMDLNYENETGLSSHMDNESIMMDSGCYRENCAIWADVVKSEQRLYLYVNGSLQDTWKVSTGIAGRSTPDFDKHPDGRIYTAYTSTKYPGGDYHGLGNMPYAVFISGGFAIHGTPFIGRLGERASHGCIRVHPDNAHTFNQLVRANGVRNTWVTVED